MNSVVIKPESKDLLGSLRGFLGQLLEAGVVQAVLVPKVLPSKDGFVQSLVTDVQSLQDAHPLAPTMAVQSAHILEDLTRSPLEGRVGAVLKPCELRATTELSKFLRVDLEQVLTIGVDCLGTYEAREYADKAAENEKLVGQLDLDGVADGKVTCGRIEENGYREACQLCVTPSPKGADISVGLFGYEPLEGYGLVAGEGIQQELAEKLSLEFSEADTSVRDKALEAATSMRKQKRDEVFKQMMAQTGGLEQLLGALSSCIRCHNCMNVCPICYCNECVFDSSVFEHRADQFLNWAKKKGALRMPTDTLI